MQFKTILPVIFLKKIKDFLPQGIGKKVIEIYTKVNNKDIIAGKIMADGLVNLFDLDTTTQKKVIFTLENFTKQNIFLGAYFLKHLDILNRYNLLDEMTRFLMDLAHHSGRKAAYTLCHIDKALIVATPEYMKILIKYAHIQMPTLGWASGVILKQAIPLYQSFGQNGVKKIILLAVEIFPCRPLILEHYFYVVPKLFSILSMVQVRSILLFIAKEKNDEIVCNQIHALSYIPKNKLISLTKKINIKNNQTLGKLLQLRYQTLAKNNYFNVFKYPKISNDLYFSAIFRRWHAFGYPTQQNILTALFKIQYKDVNHINNLLNFQKTTIQKFKNKKSENDWDNPGWLYIGKRVSLKLLVEIVEWLFATHGEGFSTKPSLFKKELKKEYKNIKKQVIKDQDLLIYIKLVYKYAKDNYVISILEACLNYLAGNFKGFISQYSQTLIIAKIWDRDPLVDMARSDELFSCTFIGDSGDYSASLYLYDKSITFMDFFIAGKRKGRAYLVLVTDENKNDLLFVDIIEGSSVIISGKNRFEFVIKAILSYAHDLCLKKVVFNTMVYYNNTPQKFIELLKEKKLGIHYYQIIRKKYNDFLCKKYLPFPKPSLLGAFKINSTSLVEGIVVNVEESLLKLPDFSFYH